MFDNTSPIYNTYALCWIKPLEILHMMILKYHIFSTMVYIILAHICWLVSYIIKTLTLFTDEWANSKIHVLPRIACIPKTKRPER